MVFNNLFKKLDKITINKCKKPNEPITYQQLESIIQNNRSIYFYDWAFFFIFCILIIGFLLNRYTLQWAKKQRYEFCKKNNGNTFKKPTSSLSINEYTQYKALNDLINLVDSVKPYVRGMVICFSLIQYFRSSLNRITPILKDKCRTPRVAYVFYVVLILLYGILAYQIYMWFSKRIEVDHSVEGEQLDALGKLWENSTTSINFETKYINKYSWIYIIVVLCSYVLSIIANFRKNTEDLMFYLEFLIGGDMTSLLSKLYLLELINTSTMIEQTGNIDDDYTITFDEQNLKIEEKLKN